MTTRTLRTIACASMIWPGSHVAFGQVDEAPKPASLSMSAAVVCSKVDGYEKFEALPSARLTKDDKLKVYFRPLHFRIEESGKAAFPYRARFTEDGRIRRKGEKTVLCKEDKLLEYEARLESSDQQVYLVNMIGLQSLKPGDYELDITLRDDLTPKSEAVQTVGFTVVESPADASKPPAEKAEAAEKPATSKPSTPKSRKATSKGKPGRVDRSASNGPTG